MGAKIEGFNNGRTIVPKLLRTGTLTLHKQESGTITAEEDMVVALNGYTTVSHFEFILGINNTGRYAYARSPQNSQSSYWMYFTFESIKANAPEQYLRRFIVGGSYCPTCFVFLRKGDVLKITGNSQAPSATDTATFYYYCYI